MKKFLIIIIITLSLGCNNQNQDKPGSIDLLSNAKDEITNLSKIASEVKYIPLKTSENSLISYIHDIKTDNARIYVFILEKILCFDKKGEFLFKLENKGRGPEEYTNIYDWDISPENNLLLLLSKKRLLMFNITENNFIFLKSLSLRDEFSKADFVPEENIILLSSFSSVGNEHFRNVFINFNGDTINVRPNYYKFTPLKNAGFAFSWSNIHYKYNNSIFFKEVTCDTIFTLSQNNKIKPYMILNSHETSPSTDTFKNFSTNIFFERTNVQSIMEVSRYIIYRLLYKKSPSFGIYNKVTKKQNIISAETFLKDDMIGGLNFEPKFCYDNKLYSWIEAFTLKNYVDSENFMQSQVKNPKAKKALKELGDTLKETDNPVLIVVTPIE
jgi:hypothetical protein